MATTRAPAWGERDAVTGYYPQYRISAARVIRALRDDTLQWIAVADPKAGRVDDFQIGSRAASRRIPVQMETIWRRL